VKIAVVTEDERQVSQHFGRAPLCVVFTVEGGVVTAREVREKPAHQRGGHGQGHGHGVEGQHANPDAGAWHAAMIEPIADCDVLIAGGMGRGAFFSLQQAGIEPIITDLRGVEEAVQAYIDGTLVNHMERLH
jgi:predicted Fe-Mo cluster-binding NifX family protein